MIARRKVEVHDGCAVKDLTLKAARLACNELFNNFILGSDAWSLCVQKFLVLGLAQLVP